MHLTIQALHSINQTFLSLSFSLSTMPLNFKSFNSNPNFGSNSSLQLQLPNFDFNMKEDGRGFDVQLLVNNSNNCQNPADYGQNNELITSQRGMSSSQIGLGQLGLRQRICDVIRRSNYPSPHRVQVQSVIDYFPVENQPGVSEVTVTEVVKTKFLTSNSTRNRLLAPNDHFISAAHQEPNFPNKSLLMSNQPFQPFDEGNGSLLDTIFHPNRIQNQSSLPNTNLFTMNDPFTARNEQSCHNMCHQNFTQNQTSSPRMSTTMSSKVNSPFAETDQPFQNICNQNPSQDQPNPNFINLGGPSSMAKYDEILDPEPVNVFEERQDENQPSGDQLQKPVHELLDECYRNLVGNRSTPLKKTPINQEKVCRRNSVEISDDEEDEAEENNDGRTHSLSRKKYGPYTCPKCKEVFITSQSFAAHVAASHYKFETFAERKKRLAAKYKKKKLHLVHSRDGITIVSDQSFKKTIQRRKAQRAGKTKSDPQVKKKKGKNIVAGIVSEGSSLVDVEIKKEYD